MQSSWRMKYKQRVGTHMAATEVSMAGPNLGGGGGGGKPCYTHTHTHAHTHTHTYTHTMAPHFRSIGTCVQG